MIATIASVSMFAVVATAMIATIATGTMPAAPSLDFCRCALTTPATLPTAPLSAGGVREVLPSAQ